MRFPGNFVPTRVSKPMAADSNPGFYHKDSLTSAANRYAISFQSVAINSTSEMIPMGNYFALNNPAGLMFSGNTNVTNNINSAITRPTTSSGSLLLDSVSGLKPEPGLAVEWSIEEQYKLEEGLLKFADEPSIMRYIKIAATLRDKTVRDVALRCRWMTGKRRKPEELSVGKKLNQRKDKLVESSSKMNITSPPPLNPYSLMVPHMNWSEQGSYKGISGVARHLLELNAQAFSQIAANISSYKLQDNIDLFRQARNNICAILNDMRDMPGIMRKMPPLPVSIDEGLANSVLRNTTWQSHDQGLTAFFARANKFRSPHREAWLGCKCWVKE